MLQDNEVAPVGEFSSRRVPHRSLVGHACLPEQVAGANQPDMFKRHPKVDELRGYQLMKLDTSVLLVPRQTSLAKSFGNLGRSFFVRFAPLGMAPWMGILRRRDG